MLTEWARSVLVSKMQINKSIATAGRRIIK